MSVSPEVLLERAAQARRENRPNDARRDLLEAVAHFRTSSSERLPRALTALGQIERDLHNFDAALGHYQEAAEMYRSGDPLRLAHTIRHVADIHAEQNNAAAAEPLYTEALAIYRGQPAASTLDLANAIRGMAVLKQQTGATAEARALWAEARDHYTRAGIPEAVAETSRRIAML